MLLNRYENEGVLHVASIQPGNDTLAKELLITKKFWMNMVYAW